MVVEDDLQEFLKSDKLPGEPLDDDEDDIPDPDGFGYDDDADESDPDEDDEDLLSEYLGDRKKFPLIGVLVAVSILAAFVMIFWGDDILKRKPGGQDSLAVAETLPDSIELTSPGAIDSTLVSIEDGDSQETEEPVEEPEEEKVPVEEEDEIELAESETVEEDTVERDELGFADDEFLKLLNAVVSSEEVAYLDSATFYDRLFEPIIPDPEKRLRRVSVAEIGEKADSIRMVVSDSTVFTNVIDSLMNELDNMNRELRSTARDNIRLQKLADKTAFERDSLQQIEIKKLAKIVDVMAPDVAARMLSGRKEQELTEILFRVKPRTAAKVIKELPSGVRSRIAANVMTR